MDLKLALILGLIFLISFTYADVGPGPTKPDITIWMQENGSTHTEIDQITYHCNGTDNRGTGAVEISAIDFTCVKGACKNNNWYYKFNPCFYSSGYIGYTVNGESKKSEWIDFSEAKQYTYNLDVVTGKFMAIEPEPACLGGFILPGLLVGAVCAFRVRK
jgi:hypothetical protein